MRKVNEALRQLIDGRDFTAPRSLLRISAGRACDRHPAAPYSIAENIAHADGWQRLWLSEVRGDPKPHFTDWPDVAPAEWPAIRESFCAGLEDALRLSVIVEEGQAETLLRIAVHGAYHIGQCALLKRLG